MIKYRCLLIICLLATVYAPGSSGVPVIDPHFFTGSGFNQRVTDMALQPDGKVVVVGLFDYAVGVSSRRIVRLNVDGTVDPMFDAGSGANLPIRAVVLQSDGKILIGGEFTMFDGNPVNKIARLHPNGRFDRSFDPGSGTNQIVYAIELQPDGKILVGGNFTTFAGTSAGTMVRLEQNGSRDDTFLSSQLGGKVETIELMSNGSIIVGGDLFMPGFNRNIARISASGVWDGTFNATITGGEVLEIRSTPAGIYVAGKFNSVNNVSRTGIARLSINGALDNTFAWVGTQQFASISIQSDGKVIAGGGSSFETNNLRRINPNGATDPTFSIQNRGGEIHAIVAQPNGQVIIGGRFDAGGQPGSGGARPAGVKRVNDDGNPDTTFVTRQGSASDWVDHFALQPDGKILISGGFSFVGNVEYPRFARLHPDGTVDQSFTPAVNNFSAMATQPDGRIIVGGSSSGQSGTIPILRLNVDGSIDPTFTAESTSDSGPLGELKAIWIESDGKIIVAGGFHLINGAPRKGIARLNPDGTLDETFTLNLVYNSATIYKVIRNSEGKLLIVGRFVTGSGSPNLMFRLNAEGIAEAMTSFGSQFPTESPLVTDVAFDDHGRVFVAGYFAQISGTNIKNIARINPDGLVDLTFSSPALTFSQGGPGNIISAAPMADGRILVGGQFSTIAGIPKSSLALLNGDGTLDESFPLSATHSSGPASVSGFLRQYDGRILVRGTFAAMGGVSRDRVSRMVVPSPDAAFDYDGDGKTDISLFRPSDGNWYLQQSTDGFYGVNFGIGTDKIVPADYDGDGKTDVAVYRSSTGIWYVVNSSDGTFSSYAFGIEEDLPAPADYDGDGKADVTVFRPSTGTWYRQNSSDGSFAIDQFGTDGDVPTVGDFDGDGKADVAVFRPSGGVWYQLNSSDGSFFAEQFGISIDKIVPADYDGDGKTDIAIYRPADGLWYVKNSSDSSYVPYIFGIAEDIPVPGDYDGDGKADIAVFRPSNGHWYIANSSNATFTIFPWGQSGDRPTPGAFGN